MMGADNVSEKTNSFALGDFRIHILPDTVRKVDASILCRNAPAAELQALLRQMGSDGKLDNIFGCTVIQTRRETVLVDTGMSMAPAAGQLPAHMRSVGLTPSDIDVVILTHAHPDHIGGLLASDGSLRFPNASYWMWRDEWDFWTDEENLVGQPEGRANAARRFLPPIAGRLSLVSEAGAEMVPGLAALPTPGHSPGHMAVQVTSQGKTLLLVGDALLNAIHVQHPEWVADFDMDKQQVPHTRRQLLTLLAESGWLMSAYHFPLPSLGTIRRQGDRFLWQPTPL